MDEVKVVGGGLAGSEAAWQAAQRGLKVKLFEMRPAIETGAHQTDKLAELVCSNSLGSRLADRASGVLMAELSELDSLLLRIAKEISLPAGGALAVDRHAFSNQVTEILEAHPRIEIIRDEVKAIPEGLTILASGPLTSQALSSNLSDLTGEDHLFFFDAISPIVEFESIDMQTAFWGSRYERGTLEKGDYINCPLDRAAYEQFVEALVHAERIQLKSFEQQIKQGVTAGAHAFFEGCLPIEIIAERGPKALAFGPMRPVGLRDPRSDARPHAVLQLRQDDMAGSLFNLVGFQTNLTFPEQRRVLRMIPGLENARFARYGQMHRNTFINSPRLLRPTLQYAQRDDLFFAGQITGVEGYLGNIATGALAGINAARQSQGLPSWSLPVTTMLGALVHYVTHADPAHFQPMKANFGILPPLEGPPLRGRRARASAHAARSTQALKAFLNRETAHSH